MKLAVQNVTNNNEGRIKTNKNDKWNCIKRNTSFLMNYIHMTNGGLCEEVSKEWGRYTR